MPKFVRARPPLDDGEAGKIRGLAGARMPRWTGSSRAGIADPGEIAHATRVATAPLSARARPWIWGRPEPKHRSYRRRFIHPLRNVH